jgi:hypothetical protein
MRTLLVGYDLDKPGQNYPKLEAALKEFGVWWHELDSTWIVRADLTTVQLRDQLAALVDSNDKLLVIDITGDAAAWKGFTSQGGQWILDNIG